MKLTPIIPRQDIEELESHYIPSGDEDEIWSESLVMMRALIRFLGHNVEGSEKYVIRQLDTLHISDPINSNDMSISAWNGYYNIEFDFPSNEAPFYGARVVGRTKDLEEAVKMFQAAFDYLGKTKY